MKLMYSAHILTGDRPTVEEATVSYGPVTIARLREDIVTA